MEFDDTFDELAEDLKDEDLSLTSLLPVRLRQINERLSNSDKHVLMWDILLNSSPKYRKAVSSRLRRMVAETNSRTPSPNLQCFSPRAQKISKSSLISEDKTMVYSSADVEQFMKILKELRPWWYVLNVDQDMTDISTWCYSSIKEYLSPNVDWADIWVVIQPLITIPSINGKVRLKPLN